MSVVSDCPKHMVYGPCGGVRSTAACEVDDRRCPFVDAPLVRWPEGSPPDRAAPATGAGLAAGALRAGGVGEGSRGLPAGLARGAAVIADLRVRPWTCPRWRRSPVSSARSVTQCSWATTSRAALPFASSSFDAAWALGVLSTTSAQAEVLAEV